jgi:hypothetical protein
MCLYENINNKYKRKHKKIFLCFLIHLCICLLVIFVSFLTPLSNYTSPRQEQCFLQLQRLFEEISKLHNGNYNNISSEEITVILSQAEPQRCNYKWVGGKLSFCGIPILICCCNHQSTITNYEKFVLHKNGHALCCCLLNNGNIVLVQPEEIKLTKSACSKCSRHIK